MSDQKHLTPEMFKALARGDLELERVVRRVMDHLLGQCPTCKAAYDAYHEELLSGHRDTLEAIPAMLRKARESRSQGHGWILALRPLPQPERLAAIRRARKRFRGEGFVRLLLHESRQALPADAKRSGEWAEAAEVVLERSGIDNPELLALATAYRGNAQRALGRLPEARALFERAAAIAGANHENVPLSAAAELLRLGASLAIYERDFATAEQALQQAVMAFFRCGQLQDAVSTMIQLGILHDDMGNVERAIEIARLALEYIDADREPELYVVARFNLATHCYEDGRYQEAREILDYDEDLLAAYPDHFFQVRVLLLRGKLAAVRGDDAFAEGAFKRVREELAEMGSAFQFAVVSLDLALLYLRQGRMPEVAGLAGEMLELFEAQEVHQYAYAALRLFSEAAASGTVTEGLVRKLAEYLEDAERDPGAVFGPAN